MNKSFKILCVLAAMTIFTSACASQSVQAQPAKAYTMKPAIYDVLLGKSVGDREVADFIAGNDCSPVEQFQLCRSAGVALVMDADQKVESVILYPGEDDGFTAYQGELPFQLKINDTREAVETKLKEQRVGTGTPNEQGLFDHTHCWATYYAAGLTIIYNSPSADDKGATIHAILVGK
jgi:hypothetical protein